MGGWGGGAVGPTPGAGGWNGGGDGGEAFGYGRAVPARQGAAVAERPTSAAGGDGLEHRIVVAAGGSGGAGGGIGGPLGKAEEMSGLFKDGVCFVDLASNQRSDPGDQHHRPCPRRGGIARHAAGQR